MRVKVKDFLEKWTGDFEIMDETGSVYCSYRKDITEELANKEIVKIILECNMFTEPSGSIQIII